jgi:hypothetical protein
MNQDIRKYTGHRPYYDMQNIKFLKRVGGLVFYLRYLYLFAYSHVQHTLTISGTWRVSYKRQELLDLR